MSNDVTWKERRTREYIKQLAKEGEKAGVKIEIGHNKISVKRDGINYDEASWDEWKNWKDGN